MSPQVDLEQLAAQLKAASARFAYLHGSQVSGKATARSDLDVAAWFGRPVDAWAVLLPGGVDLLVLDAAPLELAGRVALHGRLLFEADPPARVEWEATTRKIYLGRATAPEPGPPRLRAGTAPWLMPSDGLSRLL